MERLQAAAQAHAAAGGAGPVLVDGVPLADLCLSFVLPGRPQYELAPGGADTAVADAAGLRAYVAAVVDASLGSGVAAQLAAFRAGFDAIFPLDPPQSMASISCS